MAGQPEKPHNVRPQQQEAVSDWLTPFSLGTMSASAYIDRVRTHPGKPGIYWNLIIRIPGLEYTGILSKVLENTGI